MKIEFKKIEIRNFMSFAEESFDIGSCKGMNLIQGKNNDIPGSKNGSGKSNLMASLLYALFGQFQNKIRNENIANKYATDKDMDVALHLVVDGLGYKIRRGLIKGKTSYLELFKIEDGHDVDITKSTIVETQDFIEKNVIHCDISIFLRTILLTSDQAYNFYMLKKADKKDFVEKLFDISVFEDMHKSIHRDVLSLDKESLAAQNRIMVLNKSGEDYAARKNSYEASRKTNIGMMQHMLVDLEKKYEIAKSIETKSNVESIAKLQATIDALQKDYSNKLETRRVIDSKMSKIDVETHKIVTTKTSIKSNIEKHKDIIKKLCKDCQSVFMKHYSLDKMLNESKDLDSKKSKLIKAKKTLDEQLANASIKITETKTKIDKAMLKMHDLVEESNKASKALSKAESELNDTKRSLKKLQDEKNPYLELIAKNKADLADEIDRLSKIDIKMSYLKFAENIVSQDTIRKFIIKDLIVLLNNKIKTYLTKLGAKYYVVFDEDMDYEFITSSGTYEWSNFSAGERMRIMIATSFAFRDFMSIRNGLNANVLVLDEYFDSAIDALCVDSILDILKEYSDSQNQNIFVISHRPEVNIEKFDRLIVVEKTNNISHVTTMLS